MKNLNILINSFLKTNSITNKFLLFIICLIELTLIVWLLPVYFELNDDTAMNAIASGAISGSPSEYLMFTNIIIGYLLKFLFTNVPKVNWYTWYLLTSLFMGYFAIQYSFASQKGSLWLKALKHILILALLLTSILTITFTEIATVVLIGGILLIYTAQNKNYLALGSGVFLIVLGALIRADVFKMIFLISAPLFLYLLYIKHYQKLLLISLSLLFSFGAVVIDYEAFNSNPEFKEYKEFSQLRSKLTAFDNSQLSLEDKLPVIKDVNWSRYDYDLVTSFNLDVGHLKFTKEKLTQVVNYGPGFMEKMSISFLYENIKTSLLTLLNFIKSKIEWLLVFICVVLLFIERKWKEVLLVATSFLYILGIALFIRIYLEGNLKPNINFGLLLPVGLLLIYFLNFDQFFNIIHYRFSPYIKMGLIVFFTGLLFFPIVQSYKTKNSLLEKIESTKKVNIALQGQPEPFYVSWVVSEFYPIFEVPYNNTKGYSLGWMAGSPSNKDKIERYTGNRDLGAYTIFNKDIVWYYEPDQYYQWFAKKVHDFYLSNYPQCTFKEEIIPITDKTFLIKHTYHIKM